LKNSHLGNFKLKKLFWYHFEFSRLATFFSIFKKM
jgi:hypothetical protein